MNYNKLIGQNVYHGSPGYETIETIKVMKERKEGIYMEFDSDCFTVIPFDDYRKLMEDGSVYFMRQFPDGKAHEALELI